MFASANYIDPHFNVGLRAQYNPESSWWIESNLQVASMINYADAIQVINSVREPLMDEQYEITFALQNTAAKLIAEGTAAEKAKKLYDFLMGLGLDFSVKQGLENPIVSSSIVVSAGKGIGEKDNMMLVNQLAWKLGGAVGSSRPVAESLQYVAMNRFVGVSGQKFSGDLYVACGISGAIQHLLGIKEAKTVVAINIDPAAPIFERADFGVVGDVTEIIPELVKLFD